MLKLPGPLLFGLALSLAVPTAARGESFPPTPGIRILGGAVWHVDPERDVLGAYDILVTMMAYGTDGTPTWGLLGGYGHEGGGTDLFQAGVEVGYGPNFTETVMLGLRGVIGSSEGQIGYGFRATAGADFLLGVFHVEVGYQLLAVDGAAEHDLRVMGGINLVSLIIAGMAR